MFFFPTTHVFCKEMCHPIILKSFGVKEWTILDVDHDPPAFEGGFVKFQNPIVFIKKTRVQAVKYGFFRDFHGKLPKEKKQRSKTLLTPQILEQTPQVLKLGFIGFFSVGEERTKTCSTIFGGKNQGILHACSFSGSLSRRCIHAVDLVLRSWGRSLDVNGTQDALAGVVLGADSLQGFFLQIAKFSV